MTSEQEKGEEKRMEEETEVRFSVDYPCWRCGMHHVTAVRRTMDDKGLFAVESEIRVECPKCGLLFTGQNCDVESVERVMMRNISSIPRDPEARMEYFTERRILTECRNNMGKDALWMFEGVEAAYGAEFHIAPTSCNGVRTLYIGHGMWDEDERMRCDEYAGFMTPENARALRDALNAWLDDESEAKE